MHERIRKFSHEGKIRDNTDFIRLQDVMRNMLEDQMRNEGYIPQLDCGVHWSPQYNEAEKCFEFKITMYGVFVGKKESCTEAAYYDGRIHRAES